MCKADELTILTKKAESKLRDKSTTKAVSYGGIAGHKQTRDL